MGILSAKIINILAINPEIACMVCTTNLNFGKILPGIIFDVLMQRLNHSCSDGMATYSRPHPGSNLSKTFRFRALESKEGLGRYGLNV